MIEGIPARTMSVAPPSPASDRDSRLKKVAGQLEGLFVQQLFKTMRETVPQGEGIVSGGIGEEIFTGLLDQHLAAETPKQMESGIAEALYRQLRGMAGAAPTVPDAAIDASAAATSPISLYSAPSMHTGSSAI